MTTKLKSDQSKNFRTVEEIMQKALSDNIKDFNSLGKQIREKLTDTQLEEIVEKAKWYWPRRLALNELTYRDLRQRYPDLEHW